MAALVERDADPTVAAPDGMAAAHELISLYDQREGLRQAEGIGDIEPCAARGNVPDHAVDAAASTEGEGAMLEYPVSWRSSFLVHCRKFPSLVDRSRIGIARANCG